MSAPHPLHPRQMAAVSPEDTVWLSASAGTGKTQVLSSRVLRLLLRPGVSPSQILCLTFTKAGATEMAERINSRLARWVRLDDAKLAVELKAIGAAFGPETLARARTLFAAVLDCPGGGLRIDTIHAFAQWLLGAFPHEAGLIPGSRPMEDRERVLLMRQVLADLLTQTEKSGRQDLLDALAALSLRMAPDGVEAFLLRCADARDAWFGAGAWQEPLGPSVNRLLGLAPDASPDDLVALCGDDAFDLDSLRLCLSAYRQWTGKKGQAGSSLIAAWIAVGAEERLLRIGDLHTVLFTQKDTVRDQASLEKFEEFFGAAAERVLTQILALRERRALLDLAALLAPALTLGRAFALAWDEAKRREGLVDFDDQIRRAADLLGNSAYAQWIGYKLDRQFDHILVDEAQDTNAAQWAIIRALTQEFFSGEGQRDGVLRTLFVVGDYKQAIFRFQGTSPENFENARNLVESEMGAAAQNFESLFPDREGRRLRDLGLDRSFRTAQPVLDFVDRTIGHLGHDRFGLATPPEPHVGEARPGYVALWRTVGGKREEPEDEGDEGADGWLSRSDRRMADQIARQVRQWMDHGYPLIKGGARRATAGDVMVLVRKRRELAGLIVARLHAAGVPVAGVDRLRLGAPLAVRDLLAALRFAAQPLDDLNLAALLVSPLIGWSQDQLLADGYRDRHVALWDHLRRARHPVTERLGEVLALADYVPPQALLHWLLVGPWQGRRQLVARLGAEANDPIDELLNAASAYAATAVPSLVGFLAWFEAGEGELKREAGSGGDMVRVMTVHGSKGLQAPIVILADAAGNPEQGRGGRLDLADPHAAERRLPLPDLRREERAGRIADEHERVRRAEDQEHWRLLYVAMTRAEEALFIGGALAARETEPAEGSWYAQLAQVFGTGEWVDDPLWGGRLEHGDTPVAPSGAVRSPELSLVAPLPEWLVAAPMPEPRPPRPLAPSALAEDLATDPPLPPGAGREAARRGVLIHRLLERLPDVAAADRADAALRWLGRHGADLTAPVRAEISAAALAVIDDPRWTELFGPAALAEVPIAALVGERVVAGTIDRLLIAPDRIRLVDFKTARRPPADLAGVPEATLRQLAAYAAALAATYPGRAVEAAVLYTQVPQLIAIPADMLAIRKRALLGAQESF